MEDVVVSPWDLRTLGRGQNDCLQVDRELFKPVPAISKAGMSTATMFGRQKGEDQQFATPKKGDISVKCLQGGNQSTRDMTIKDYAKLFDKYYDAAHGSQIDRMIAKNKGKRDPALDASIDTEISSRASREPRVKYLSAALADKYAIQNAAVTGAPPRPPQVLGLTMVPANVSTSQQQDTHSSQRVMELAQTLAEQESMKTQHAEHLAKAEEDARRAYVARAAMPMPASQAFRATTREQAAHAGRVGVAAYDTPGPGKYDPKWKYWEKPPPSMLIVPPCYKDEMTPQRQRAALASAGGRRHTTVDHDAQSQSSTEGSTAGGAMPSSANPFDRLGSQMPFDRSGSQMPFERSGSQMPFERSGSQMHGKRQTHTSDFSDLESGNKGKGSAANRRSHSAAVSRSGTAKSTEYINLFKDAHHVHPPKDFVEGTSSFKATTRPPLANNGGNGGTHLALKYYREGIDDVQRRQAHLVMPFDRQTARPKELISSSSSTGNAIGPGSYIRYGEMPTSLMGKHVEAGHKGIKRTVDFSKSLYRPGSAPVSNGLHPSPPPVSAAETQGALNNLFRDLNPSELISLQELQPHIHPARMSFTKPPSPVKQEKRSWTTSAIGLGPKETKRYGSAGLSRSVKGGSFARTTRAQEIQGMRVCSDGNIIPPASAPLHKIRPINSDVYYDQTEPEVQGKHARSPHWKLPPNRVAMSNHWISAAALAYV